MLCSDVDPVPAGSGMINFGSGYDKHKITLFLKIDKKDRYIRYFMLGTTSKNAMKSAVLVTILLVIR